MVATDQRNVAREARFVVFASSLGTLFEWYDFFLFGSLATVIGAQFFSAFAPAVRDLFALLTFAASFLVRPCGALVFGRIGDLAGRKYTFLVTIVLMGLSTFLVGLLPNAAAVGIAAPISLLACRLTQGLAIGGEYGGAATYVAENARPNRRGYYTAFIQAMAPAALLLSLCVIVLVRNILGETAFAAWGWRIPFLLSIMLLAISIWVRMQLKESPLFQRMKEQGRNAKAPLSEAFGTWRNVRIVLIALFGAVMGQGVVGAIPLYALFFLQQVLRVDAFTVNLLIAWPLLLSCGCILIFGALSDRIGRKSLILSGCLLATLTMIPIFHSIAANANPALSSAMQRVQVQVLANPSDCSNLFNPVGTRTFSTSCDVARTFLASSAVKYTLLEASWASSTIIRVNGVDIPYRDATSNPEVIAALQSAGYPKLDDRRIVRMSSWHDLWHPQILQIIGWLFLLMLFMTMVYGPMSALMVEMFPTRIRYTSMSLPYHVGNGWFGGLMPATAYAIVAASGDIYAGLWYPVILAGATSVIGWVFLPETKNVAIDAIDR